MIGDGNIIKFWLNCWNECPLIDILGITYLNQQFLKENASSYIFNHQWHLPMSLQLAYPSLTFILNQTHIPIEDMKDKCIWNLFENGELTLKRAYDYKDESSQVVYWGKIIWNVHITPSRSLLFWRFIHNRLRTDDYLATRGLHSPSMCNTCLQHSESSYHFFKVSLCKQTLEDLCVIFQSKHFLRGRHLECVEQTLVWPMHNACYLGCNQHNKQYLASKKQCLVQGDQNSLEISNQLD